MDEPFGALDPITRAEIQLEFKKLQQELAKTTVFVTHDVGEALMLGDRIALMEAGRLRSVLEPREFLDSSDPVAQEYARVFRAGQHVFGN
jgi:osmoprotectant transport system ATP-binding protein